MSVFSFSSSDSETDVKAKLSSTSALTLQLIKCELYSDGTEEQSSIILEAIANMKCTTDKLDIYLKQQSDVAKWKDQIITMLQSGKVNKALTIYGDVNSPVGYFNDKQVEETKKSRAEIENLANEKEVKVVFKIKT